MDFVFQRELLCNWFAMFQDQNTLLRKILNNLQAFRFELAHIHNLFFRFHNKITQ